MNNNSPIVRRYAQALLMIALEQKAADLYQEELESFINNLNSQPELLEKINNPQIKGDVKKVLIKKLMPENTSNIIANFLNLVVDKKRERYFTAIFHQFIRYADDARNIVDAEVRSAVQLTDKDFRDLQKRLSQATGKNVRLNPVIDTSLLGGMMVRIGEKVIDGSLLKRLSLLKSQLSGGTFKELR